MRAGNCTLPNLCLSMCLTFFEQVGQLEPLWRKASSRLPNLPNLLSNGDVFRVEKRNRGLVSTNIQGGVRGKRKEKRLGMVRHPAKRWRNSLNSKVKVVPNHGWAIRTRRTGVR